MRTTSPEKLRRSFYRALTDDLPAWHRCQGYERVDWGESGMVVFPSFCQPGRFHSIFVDTYVGGWIPGELTIPRICVNRLNARLGNSTLQKFQIGKHKGVRAWQISDVKFELGCSIAELPGFARWIVQFVTAREGTAEMPPAPYRIERKGLEKRILTSRAEWTTAAWCGFIEYERRRSLIPAVRPY